MASKHKYEIVDGPNIFQLGVHSLLSHTYPKDVASRVVKFKLNFEFEGKLVKGVVWDGCVHLFERQETWGPDRKFEDPYHDSGQICRAGFLVIHFQSEFGGPEGMWVYGYYSLQKRTGWLDRFPEHFFKDRSPLFLFKEGGLLLFLLKRLAVQ